MERSDLFKAVRKWVDTPPMPIPQTIEGIEAVLKEFYDYHPFHGADCLFDAPRLLRDHEVFGSFCELKLRCPYTGNEYVLSADQITADILEHGDFELSLGMLKASWFVDRHWRRRILRQFLSVTRAIQLIVEEHTNRRYVVYDGLNILESYEFLYNQLFTIADATCGNAYETFEGARDKLMCQLRAIQKGAQLAVAWDGMTRHLPRSEVSSNPYRTGDCPSNSESSESALKCDGIEQTQTEESTFLNLIVDAEKRIVVNARYAKELNLSVKATQWSMFLALYNAGNNGLAADMLKIAYVGDWDNHRATKSKLNVALKPLGVCIAAGEWRLVNI